MEDVCRSSHNLHGTNFAQRLRVKPQTSKLCHYSKKQAVHCICGVITLLPKEDSNLLLLSNWRPITLLNTDYKIASKAIAKRIERVLPSIIHPD